MADIFDYITWRGDLTFEQDGVNCVDALIFSQMAYFPMDRLWGMEEDGIITIRQVQERLQEKLNQGEHVEFHMEKDEKLFHAMASSRRFGELALSGFVNIIDAEEEKQFAAVTVHLSESLFLLFRGTDCTFVGWNEDLNMSFSTPVPAQVEAVNYFEKTAERFTGKIRLGGHSKGGNLAVYAALFCRDSLRSRIAGVYNNDGPGFDGNVVTRDMFTRLDGRLHTFVPQSSVVGMLLDHEEEYTVVHSRQIGIMQHDLYSWDVKGPDFIRLESVTEGSRLVDQTLKSWLGKLSPQQRHQVIEAVFDVFYSTEAETFRQLADDPLKHSGRLLKSVRDTDTETRKLLWEAFSLLLQSLQKNLTKNLTDQIRLPDFLQENMK